MKQQKLFAAICPTFGPRFAFHAKDEAQATAKITAWNRYHDFQRDLEARHSAKPIEAGDLEGLEISVHNDYLEHLRY